MDTNGKVSKNVVLQWGELPTSVGKFFFPTNVKPVLSGHSNEDPKYVFKTANQQYGFH